MLHNDGFFGSLTPEINPGLDDAEARNAGGDNSPSKSMFHKTLQTVYNPHIHIHQTKIS